MATRYRNTAIWMAASNIYEFIKQLKYQLNDLKTVKTNLMNILPMRKY